MTGRRAGAGAADAVPIYVEVAAKRSFAGALDWPGWCRHGRTEADAVAALLEYGPRYAGILRGTRLGFTAPTARGQLEIVERLAGNATTEFGAPGQMPSVDLPRDCDAATLRRLETILRAGWRAFDAAVAGAAGRELAKGPRGGGRSLEQIVAHVVEAEAGYLSLMGGKAPKEGPAPERLAATREAVLATLRAAAAGAIAETGPRGGKRWTARYSARRLAWHVIAHVWEIERRQGA